MMRALVLSLALLAQTLGLAAADCERRDFRGASYSLCRIARHIAVSYTCRDDAFCAIGHRRINEVR